MIEGGIVGGWTHSILILESQWIVNVYEDNERFGFQKKM